MIEFHPKKKMVLWCDFEGNLIPEMVKKRPVVIITKPLPHRDNLYTIVPLSTTPPQLDVNYVVELSRNYGGKKKNKIQYAKCDMVCSVSRNRLDRLKFGTGYEAPEMDEKDFNDIIQGVKYALNFSA